MSIFQQNKAFYGKPFRLTPEQQAEPIETLKELFDNFRLDEIRETLAQLFEVAISTENHEFSEARERSNILMGCRQIEEMLEAAYILSSKASQS